jgi:hypothetical protein
LPARLFVGAALIGMLQADLPRGFFDAPAGPIACRQIEITAADSAAYVYEFLDGEKTPRETLTAFDSAGTPLHMTVNLTEYRDTVATAHNVAVRFTFGGFDLQVDRSVRNGVQVDESARVVSESELSESEVKSARQLAVWYWDHRCRKTAIKENAS